MADMFGHNLVYLSDRERRSVASANCDGSMYHGSTVRSQPSTGAEAQRAGAAFTESIERGLKSLYDGSSPRCVDVVPRSGAAVEALDYYDVFSGEHVVVWRVACVERKRGA